LRLRLFAITILVLATAVSTVAAGPLDVKEYVALRAKDQACVSISRAKDNAADFVGKVIEIRGKVVGISASDRCSSIIISTSDGSFVIDSDVVPSDNPGVELACLVSVGEGAKYSLSDLRLVAYTYDTDLRRLEEAWRKDAEAAAARQREIRDYASRSRTVREATSKRTQPQAAAGSLSIEEITRIYKNAIKSFNHKLTDAQADTIARSVLGFSAKYKLDPRLVCAVILAESHFRLQATSRTGAQGLGQLMPSTAAGLGVDNAYDPVQNIYGSARYIRSMLDRVAGKSNWNDLTWYDLGLALAAYNAGPGAVKKHGGIPPYRETQAYVRRVTDIYRQLCGVGG